MSLAGEPLANVLRVLGRFRRNPEAFLGAQGLDLDRWMTECVVLLSAGESSSASSAAAKDSDAAKLHVLQLWQEYAPLLFVQSSKRYVLGARLFLSNCALAPKTSSTRSLG